MNLVALNFRIAADPRSETNRSDAIPSETATVCANKYEYVIRHWYVNVWEIRVYFVDFQKDSIKFIIFNQLLRVRLSLEHFFGQKGEMDVFLGRGRWKAKN
jgi:hypothetical protein